MDTMEPTPIGDTEAFAALQARLEAKGLTTEPFSPEENEALRKESPEDAAERHQIARDARMARWQARIPPLYAQARLAHLDGPQEPAKVQTWINSQSPTLWLAGAMGTGKTYAAYAAAAELVDRGAWVEVYNLTALMDALRPDGDPRAWDAVANCDVLVLDDIAQTRATEWAAERFLLLADTRVSRAGRQIITTNVTSERLAELWGEQSVNRLMDRSMAVVYRGESRRKPAEF